MIDSNGRIQPDYIKQLFQHIHNEATRDLAMKNLQSYINNAPPEECKELSETLGKISNAMALAGGMLYTKYAKSEMERLKKK